MATYKELRKISVNEHTEKKGQLTYLSWAWAWDEFKQQCPDATYEIGKNADGLPYFESHAGAMVYTKVTTNGETHEMWLPVMDGANKAMKNEPYTYTTSKGEKTVEAFNMFDVNKTLMRCLVKNLAMFGLGIYIYAGEDLPEQSVNDFLIEINNSKSMDELREVWLKANKAFPNNEELTKAKDKAKEQLK